jgi:DNA repair ATPase RecN
MIMSLIRTVLAFFKPKQKNKESLVMAKADVVAAQKAAILAGEDAALQAGLEAVYDLAIAEAPAGGGFSQEDMDAAVKAAVDPLMQQVADLQAKDDADLKALADAKAETDAKLAEIQGQLDQVKGERDADEKLIQGMKDSAEALQQLVDKLHALFPA